MSCASPAKRNVLVLGIHKYEKSVRVCTWLLIPLLKALALPFPVERATPEAHAEYVYT